MAQFNTIHANIWEDEKIRKLQDPRSKLLFIYLFSNPRCPISGIYKISLETMSFETGIVPDCKANLEELIHAGLISNDCDKNVIWIHGKIKHDQSWTTPMRIKSIRRSLAEFSSCSFIQSIFEKYPFLKDLAIEEEIRRKELRGCRAKEPEGASEAEKESASETGGFADGMDRVS